MFTSSSTRVTLDEKGCRVREVFERSCASLDPASCADRRAVFRKCPGDVRETLVESSGTGEPAGAAAAATAPQTPATAAAPGGGAPPMMPWPNDRAAPYAGRAQDV